MKYEQQSRRPNAPTPAAAGRSISDRFGQQNSREARRNAEVPPSAPPRNTPPRTAQSGRRTQPPRQGAAPGTPRGTAQMNPQRAGYRQGAPRPPRRVTQAQQLRRRNRRRVIGAGVVLAVMLLGIVLSINLLFKITAFRIENFDRTTPADTGIYSEEEIISALGLEEGDKLFFSTGAKAKQLESALPYLDKIQVGQQMPGTVVIKVHPATERFSMMYSGGWIVLSDSLKILRIEVSKPENLILLEGNLPSNFLPVVGQYLTLETYNSLLKEEEQLATPESAQATADETLATMLASLESEGVLARVSSLDVRDMSDLGFVYDGRIDVRLGGVNSLEYKLRMAGTILMDTEKGLTESDRGVLDISRQQSDGDIRAYFQPEEPQPTPAAEEEPQEEETSAA